MPPLTFNCFAALTPSQQWAAIYEALIGGSVGSGFSVSDTNTRPADTTAYAIGDAVTTGFDLTNAATYDGRSLQINSVTVMYGEAAVPSGMTTFTLYLFSVPTASVDNAAFSIGASVVAAQATYLGAITTSAAFDAGAVVVATANSLTTVVVPESRSLYGVLVTNAVFTPAASTVVGVTVNGRNV